MQTGELVAGRELDRQIHTQVMGQGDVYYKPYSTDISAAWQVVEHMQHQFGLIGVNNFILTSQEDGTWYCEFPQPKWMEGTGETAPLAICRAALAAVNDGI